MASPFSDILHSRQFKFLIGEEECPIIVHSGAIAALSLSLDRLVNGPMKEAQENVARLTELKVADFERICEFAYRGDYTDPIMTRFSDEDIDITKDYWVSSESIASREEEAIHSWLLCEFLTLWYGDYKLAFDCKESTVWSSSLPPLDYGANGWNKLSDREDDSTSATTWKDDVSSILLGHARLYVFADKYCIDGLRDLALHKLHKFLTGLTIFRLTRDAIMELVNYAYDNEHTSDRGMQEQLDPLRALIISFVALHRTAFSDFPGHVDALKEMNEYAMDFVSVLERMLYNFEE